MTSYRLSPSLRAISSGRRPCWLYRAASRRCDAVPGSRGPRGAAGVVLAGLAFAGVELAWAALRAVLSGRHWAGRHRPGRHWPGLCWSGRARPGARSAAARGPAGLAEGAAPLVVVLALSQFGLGVLVQQQVLLGRLVDPDRDHGQALEVLRLALRLQAVVIFLRPFRVEFIPAGDALGHVRFSSRHPLSKTAGVSVMFLRPSSEGRDPRWHGRRGHMTNGSSWPGRTRNCSR